MNARRLADGSAVTYPRPRLRPLAGLLWWLVWSVWCFAAGVLVGLDWTP